jgi:hypothetical protein
MALDFRCWGGGMYRAADWPRFPPKRLEGPSVRLVAPADVHLTLIPPWREASVPAAIEKLRLAARASEAFWLTFRHVGYGPEPGRPRMLWVDCEAGKEIAILRASLLQAYGQTEERPFRPHVTWPAFATTGGELPEGTPSIRGCHSRSGSKPSSCSNRRLHMMVESLA